MKKMPEKRTSRETTKVKKGKLKYVPNVNINFFKHYIKSIYMFFRLQNCYNTYIFFLILMLGAKHLRKKNYTMKILLALKKKTNPATILKYTKPKQ